MNKFDRVVSILILLQTKRIVKAQELADRFEVSLRTIYRDLRTLEHAGVPIHAEAGIGYSIVEGYSLPPVMFTPDEAISFIVAEKLLERMTDDNTAVLFSQAVAKIKAVLKSTEKDKMDALESHIHVSPRVAEDPALDEGRMSQIFESIDQKNTLEIEYKALYNSQLTKRQIEPLGVHFYAHFWHLIAFCQLRQDYRDFRIDRIKNIRKTGEAYSNEHPNLKDYMDEMAQQQDMTPVEILFNHEVVQYTRTEKFFHGFVSQEIEEKGIRMHFMSPSIIGMAHWLLIFTNRIQIFKPESLKQSMIRLTKELVENYS